MLISVLEKLNWFCFDVKMDGSIHVERSSFKMLGLAFSSKLDWFIAKATSKEIGAMIHSMKYICVSINLPYGRAWKTVVYVWAGASCCYLEFL